MSNCIELTWPERGYHIFDDAMNVALHEENRFRIEANTFFKK